MYFFKLLRNIMQLCAPIFRIHLMGELINKVTDLEIEQATSATVAMS